MSLCKLRQLRISGALDERRQLSPSLQRHVDACPRCRKFHRQSCAIAASLAPAPADSPPWLHTKIIARIRAAAPADESRAARRWLPATAGLGAIACAIGVVALSIQRDAPESAQDGDPQPPPAEQFVVRPPVSPHPASVPNRFEQHAKQALTQEFQHLATDIAGAKNFLTASLRNTFPGLGDGQ